MAASVLGKRKNADQELEVRALSLSEIDCSRTHVVGPCQRYAPALRQMKNTEKTKAKAYYRRHFKRARGTSAPADKRPNRDASPQNLLQGLLLPNSRRPHPARPYTSLITCEDHPAWKHKKLYRLGGARPSSLDAQMSLKRESEQEKPFEPQRGSIALQDDNEGRNDGWMSGCFNDLLSGVGRHFEEWRDRDFAEQATDMLVVRCVD